jgi:ERCC4-type nuclease
MEIKIDMRETDLLSQVKHLVENIPSYKDIKITTENLPIADVIISFNGDNKLWIERKTINDLNSSIKDGRYEEQSFRLNGLSHHNHNIIYLIEGDLNKMNRFKDNKIEKMTLYSAIFSLNYYKGFSVIRTLGLDETAIFICNSAYKLKKGEAEGRKAFYPNIPLKNETLIESSDTNVDTNENDNTNDYVSVVKKVKKENINNDNIGSIMLSQIPGVSSVTAIAIMEKYKTIYALCNAIHENEKCLNDITYTTSKSQVRKISKAAINNVIQFLANKKE